MTDKELIDNMKKYGIGYILHQLNNTSEKVQLAAVRYLPQQALRYIDNPNEKVQLAAVKKDLNSIMFIENPTEDVQLFAVTKKPSIIKVIKKPTESVQIAAVQQDGTLIKYILNPSEKVTNEAIKNNPEAIKNIRTTNINGVKKESKHISVNIEYDGEEINIFEGTNFVFIEPVFTSLSSLKKYFDRSFSDVTKYCAFFKKETLADAMNLCKKNNNEFIFETNRYDWRLQIVKIDLCSSLENLKFLIENGDAEEYENDGVFEFKHNDSLGNGPLLLEISSEPTGNGIGAYAVFEFDKELYIADLSNDAI